MPGRPAATREETPTGSPTRRGGAVPWGGGRPASTDHQTPRRRAAGGARTGGGQHHGPPGRAGHDRGRGPRPAHAGHGKARR
eukprot:15431289-Alexandrium_andersonii.AAC.1